MDIDGNHLSLKTAIRIIYDHLPVSLAPEARERVKRAQQVVAASLRRDRPIYGINTGFGKLAEVKIATDQLNALQENLVRSHACGVGEPLSSAGTRAVMLAKANTLAKGYSGIREVVVEHLLAMLNHDVLPVIPTQGSVGASGDLAPLAHLALSLIGEGEVIKDGQRLPSAAGLQQIGLQPLQLQAKEGLALLNGTHFMTGLGIINWHYGRHLALTADVIGAMSAEALLGTPAAFDARIHEARGFRGQLAVARRLQRMMKQSEIRDSHINCSRVQDPYCIRCIPQVHGAIHENIDFIAQTLATELNAATDNPLIFADDQEILSGGNFHGHPIATAMDLLSIVTAQAAAISERRIAMMMDPAVSDLPAFLIRESGLHSGFMIAQVTAASLVSENKVLSHPASVDSIPTSANKEDYVSMGAAAAVKASKVAHNTLNTLAVELLCACQALDLRAPLRPGPASQAVLKKVRESVPFLAKDRVLAGDINQAATLIANGTILDQVRDLIGEAQDGD